MTDPLIKSILQTQHPELASEVKRAISVMEKVLNIAGPGAMNVTGPGGAFPSAVPGVAPSTTLPNQPESSGDILATGEYEKPTATVDSSSSIATNPTPRMPAPELASGEAFGRYQIINTLGRGAMGAVYLAYDGRLDRHVAIKIPFVREDPIALERFYIEARATATLRSPNICPVYDVDQISGVHYISMAYIDGSPLTKLIEAGPIPPKEAASLVVRAARGIQKAHQCGVVHRDLKPDNIMIDLDGEPVVMDFGLAVRSDVDIRLTQEGSLVGSPAYMSPEQAEGKHGLIGPATDIYSLGVVLYQMLTSELPYNGSIASVLKSIIVDPPPPVSTHVPELANTEIEKICLKMMAKAPANRFVCMEDVALAIDEYAATLLEEDVHQGKRRWWPFGRT